MVAVLAIAAAQLIILPLTLATLRWLNVPQRYELVAGIFLTIVYALFASTLSTALFG